MYKYLFMYMHYYPFNMYIQIHHIKLLCIIIFRLRDGIPVNISGNSRFEGGNPENVALSILKSKRDDVGNYTCRLTNSIGNTTSDTQIDLDVQCKYNIFFLFKVFTYFNSNKIL